MRPTPRRAFSGTCVGWLAIALIASFALGAQASVPTLPDCLEGSDFIANAARARDNGMRRGAFLARLDEDLVAIRGFPIAFRCFVKDEADERFLVAAVERVFDRPVAPDQHREAFLSACFERVAIESAATH